MPNKPVLAAVSYLNTKPFLYGLEKNKSTNDVSIELLHPGALTNALLLNEAQIGLVPVAAIPLLKEFSTFGHYGIGSLRSVASVCAFSHQPMHKCKYVLLDYQSRTSVALMQVLMKMHWKLDLPVIQAEPGYETHVPEDAIALIIGDRALEARQHFKYIYDLAEAWKILTDMPFLFAAWVAHHSVSEDILQRLNSAFEYGVNHIDEAIAYFNIYLPHYDASYYLHHNIFYSIGDEQKKAQNLFLQYCMQSIPSL